MARRLETITDRRLLVVIAFAVQPRNVRGITCRLTQTLTDGARIPAMNTASRKGLNRPGFSRGLFGLSQATPASRGISASLHVAAPGIHDLPRHYA